MPFQATGEVDASDFPFPSPDFFNDVALSDADPPFFHRGFGYYGIVANLKGEVGVDAGGCHFDVCVGVGLAALIILDKSRIGSPFKAKSSNRREFLMDLIAVSGG